jgi:hypothetical protein
MRLYPEVYRARREPALLTVPPLPVVAVDGVGALDGPAYREAVEALYGVSHALRADLRRDGVPDYAVSPLEGQWWGDVADIAGPDRVAARWTVFIAQPPQVTDALVAGAVETTRRRRPTAALEKVERRTLDEGRSVQALHVGPRGAEHPALERLLGFVEGSGHTVAGPHHEIYLSDPARTAPDRRRTILRYPVRAG